MDTKVTVITLNFFRCTWHISPLSCSLLLLLFSKIIYSIFNGKRKQKNCIELHHNFLEKTNCTPKLKFSALPPILCSIIRNITPLWGYNIFFFIIPNHLKLQLRSMPKLHHLNLVFRYFTASSKLGLQIFDWFVEIQAGFVLYQRERERD